MIMRVWTLHSILLHSVSSTHSGIPTMHSSFRPSHLAWSCQKYRCIGIIIVVVIIILAMIIQHGHDRRLRMGQRVYWLFENEIVKSSGCVIGIPMLAGEISTFFAAVSSVLRMEIITSHGNVASAHPSIVVVVAVVVVIIV